MESKPRHPSPIVRIVVGLVLLVPMLTACLLIKLVPVLQTLFRSLQEYNVVAPGEFIGLENYVQFLMDDDTFWRAVGQTGLFVLVRLLAVAILPVALGYLLARLGRWGRTLYRIWFTLVVLLAVPISLLMGWRIQLDPGSGLLGKWLSPVSPGKSLLLLLFIDGATTCAIGCTLGTMIYAMVFRGTDGNWKGAFKPLLATWLIVNAVVLLSSALIFDFPYVLARGGNMMSTTTWAIHKFINTFAFFRVGYGAALAVPLILLYALCVLVAWGVGEWARLRLVYVPASKPSDKRTGHVLVGILMIPVVLIASLPILLPHLSSLSNAASVSFELPFEPPPLGSSLAALAPLLFLAIPAAYVAAAAISLAQPLGRIGTKILALVLLLGSAVPIPLIMTSLFEMTRALHALNTVWGLMLPYLASGTAFYLFKLYFDGRHEHVDEAVRQGTPALNAIWKQAVLPSLPILLLVAVAFSFASVAVSGLPWMLVATRSPETAPWPVFMLGQSAVPSVRPEWLGTLALQWVGALFVIWVVPALLAQLFLVDRLALVSRPRSTKDQ